MSTLSLTVSDSATMLRRRSPAHAALSVDDAAVVLGDARSSFLLLFVYVFGGTLGAGLGGVAHGRAATSTTSSPAFSCMTVAAAAQATGDIASPWT